MGHFSYVLHKKTKSFILKNTKNPLFKFQMNCALGTATPNAMRGEAGICNQLRSSAGGGRTGLVRGRVLPSFSSSYHIFFHITGPVFIYTEATVFQIKKKIISISF